MDIQAMCALRDAGVDIEDSVRRFAGNAALYEKFLLRFPQDPNFTAASDALGSGDWEGLLQAVHTLKGVSGNLGLNRIFELCSQVVTLLRAEERTEAGRIFREELTAAYEEICLILEQNGVSRG